MVHHKEFFYFKMFLRYFLLLFLGLFNLYLFYLIFTPLTIYPVFFILKSFLESSLNNNVISLVDYNLNIELIEACIAGSAYYLLLILNLSTPDIKIKKRLFMILISFLFLLVLNISRILLLVVLLFYNYSFYSFVHELFWYFLSILFVLVIWFAEVRYFNIRSMPFYSDIESIYSH